MLAGVTTWGGIGVPSGAADLLVSSTAPTMTTAPIAIAMPVQSMICPKPLPELPEVPALASARLASRLARRSWRADRRLVGGAFFLPGFARPLGRL